MDMTALRRLSLWVFYGLLAYMPFHIFMSTWFGTSFGVLEVARVAKDVVLVAGFGLAVVASWGQPWLKQLWRDKLVWLILAYAILTIGLALLRPTDQDAEIVGVTYNLRFLLFFLYALLLGRLFRPAYLVRRGAQVVLAAGLLVALFGVVQYWALPNDALQHVGYVRSNGVLPAFFIDDKPDLERIMSTLRDPNSLASYLVIIGPLAAMVVIGARDPNKKQVGTGILLLTMLAVWYTFSRCGCFGFGVALATFVLLAGQKFQTVLRKQKRLLLVTCSVAVVTLLGGLFALRNTYFVQNVILHADQSTVLEDPNELRVRFFKESVHDVIADPVGSGPGTAGLASIRNNVQGTQLNENYYLQVASEVGVVGLGLFIAILVTVGRRLWGWHAKDPLVTALLASFIGLAITNVLVHIWSNEAVAYTWWGLAGLVFAKAQQRTKSS